MSKTLETFLTLFEPFSDQLKATKKQGGQKITFVEWYNYVLRAHRQFPEGYSKSVEVTQANGYDKEGEPVATLIVRCRITCLATGAYQEALGSADAGKTSWGGAVAEAESMAFRRAMANWGLGLEMYLDDNQFDLWTQGTADDCDDEDDGGDAEEGEEEDDDEGDDEDHGDDAEGSTEDEPSDRQWEVITVIGKLLSQYGDEHEDEALLDFLRAQKVKLNDPTKAKAGLVVKKFRAKLEELGLEDPTNSDDE